MHAQAAATPIKAMVAAAAPTWVNFPGKNATMLPAIAPAMNWAVSVRGPVNFTFCGEK